VSEAGVAAAVVEVAVVVVSTDVKMELLSASVPATRALHFTRRRDRAPKRLASFSRPLHFQHHANIRKLSACLVLYDPSMTTSGILDFLNNLPTFAFS
jgi:hypothetical protein